MKPPVRPLFGFAAALLAALAGVPELVAHSHGTWETELARQVTVRSTADAPCAPAQHFDPAEVEHHPSCPACLNGRVRAGVVAAAAGLDAVAPSALPAPPVPAAPQPAGGRRLARGRAPPLA